MGNRACETQKRSDEFEVIGAIQRGSGFKSIHYGAGDDRVCSGVGFDGLCGCAGVVLGLNAFALVDVEHGEVTQEGDLLDLAGVLLVLLLDPLPEDYEAGLLALADVTAFLLTLGEGQVFAGLAEDHLIQQAVGLACAVADRAALAGDDPRFMPGDHALLKLGDDPVGDLLVNILLHGFSSSCGRAAACAIIKPSPLVVAGSG